MLAAGDPQKGWLFSSDFYENLTPSRQDNMDVQKENELRYKTVLFIEELAIELRR